MKEFTFRADEGYEYRPFTDGVQVGFVVTAPNGTRQAILLRPCRQTDNGFASVNVTLADVDTDADIDPKSKTYLETAQSMAWVDLFTDEVTADTLARGDLQTMAIGAEPTAEEIRLRAAEHLDRIRMDRYGLKGLNFIEVEERSKHDGEVLDLGRVGEWLRLYGVNAGVEHGGGNVSVFSVDGGRVTLGPGWYEGTALNRRAYAATDDAYLTTSEDDPDASFRAQWSELETAWMAINILTGKPVYTFDGPRRRPAKAEPVGPPITA